MKKMNIFLVFSLLLLSLPYHALGSESEVFWVKLEKLFTYRDLERICSTVSSPSTFLFGAEIIDGKVQAAVIRTNTLEVLSERLPFTAAEIFGIQFTKDSIGRTWIGSLKLNARHLEWLFFRAGGLNDCIPPKKLATLGPNEFTYTFDVANVFQGPEISSDLGKFTGKRKDGRLYQATLSLNQRRMPQ